MAERESYPVRTQVQSCLKNIPILEFRNDHNRPKGFLFGKVHVVFHICEHSWLHKKAFLEKRKEL
jgi:hypothetical protein